MILGPSHCSVKILTKFLANRIQNAILKLTDANKYGFIKYKTIQDYLGWAFEFLHQYHQSKRGIIILKLYFEKPFDLIEHHKIIMMLEAKGFPPRWIAWVNDILSNLSCCPQRGCRKRIFKCKRGVRQGVLLYYLFLQQISYKVLSMEHIMMVFFSLPSQNI